MRRYFAVYSFNYNEVLQKIKSLTINDFAFSFQKYETRIPELSYLVSENDDLSQWLTNLEFVKEMKDNDALIYQHKTSQDFEIIGNVNMVRDAGIS